MTHLVEGNEHRGHIIGIGTFDEVTGSPVFWSMDCSECDAAALEVNADGSFLLAGWTVSELRAIADADADTEERT